MKNTEYNLDALSSMLSSDVLSAVADMVAEMGLEILEVRSC